MLISSLPDTDGSRCILTLEQPGGWLRATWRGFVDSEEALRGADNYLAQLAGLRCAYLLNDNTALHGPWFDTLGWLTRVWLPQATQLGLRYVAHVVQADTLHDVISGRHRVAATCAVSLQLFDHVPEAEAWLRYYQVTRPRLSGTSA